MGGEATAAEIVGMMGIKEVESMKADISTVKVSLRAGKAGRRVRGGVTYCSLSSESFNFLAQTIE